MHSAGKSEPCPTTSASGIGNAECNSLLCEIVRDSRCPLGGMSSQTAVSVQSFSGSVVRAAWLLASLVPAVFLLCLIALIFYAAPEYDDFCFFYTNLRDGFVQTVVAFYFGYTPFTSQPENPWG